MGKIKITNHQIFALTACYTSGSPILVVSALAADIAKQDAWIAALFTMVFGLVEMWIICFLWSHYPGMTYVEMMKQIFGKWIGSIIAACFVFLCLLFSSQVLWYIGNFMTLQVMPETPATVINAVPAAVAAIALLYGLEALARSYDIFIYFISFLFVIAMMMVLPNARIENLLPIFEGGIIPVFKASIIMSSYLILPVVILLMIFPANADNTIKARKSFVMGYLWGSSLVFISIINSILVLGSTITASSQHPVYILAKEINIENILTRLEFIVAAVWILTVLTRVILYFYAGAIGLAQLLKLEDNKRVILPLGLISLVMSTFVYPNVIYQADWDTFVWPPVIATFAFILPIAMIIASYVRSRN